MRKPVLVLAPAALAVASCTSGMTPTAQPRPSVDAAAPAVVQAAALDLFVAAPAPAAQLVFVGQSDDGRAAAWPNAVFVPLSTFSVERNGIPNELPPADSLVALLRAAGVGGGELVIVGSPIPAGRAWAGLDFLGLGSRAALLDGGPGALGSPPPGAPAPAPSRRPLQPAVRADMIVDAAWVHARLADPGVAVLDARPPAEFSGATPGEGVTRPGHIPGATNLFWQELVESAASPRLKPEAELRRLFEAAGATPGKTVVAYCRTGGQASFLYTVARHLGYDVKLYDGSYIDWSRTEYPVER